MKTANAVIVVADIEASSEYANLSALPAYNRMVREFHKRAFDAVRRYQRENGLKKDNLFGGARGDEVLLILHGLVRKRNILHALKLSLLLREAWMKSDFNSRRIEESKDFTHVRVGVGEGKLAWEQCSWAGGITPEGFAISQAKRIESEAATAPAKILIKATMRQIIEKDMPGVILGSNYRCELKGVGVVEVFPVEEYEGWLEALHKEEERKKANLLSLSQKAYAAGMAGKYNEAEVAYRKIIEINPELAVAHNNLGNALFKKGEIEEAIKEYQEAIRLNPGYVLAHNNLGVTLGIKGEAEGEIKEYREAIRLKPDDAMVHNNLGGTLLKKGEIEEAIKEYREAIRLNPDYASAHFNLGVALGRKGETDEAIQEYREAIRLKPDDAAALCNLAWSLDNLDRRKEAREYWERGSKVETKPEPLVKIKKRLAEPD